MRPGVVAAVVGLGLLGGCTATEPTAAPATTAGSSPATATTSGSSAAPVPGVLTLTCASAIDGDPPPTDYETVLGVVALPTGELGAYSSGDPTTPALFAKTGLVVRAGRAFELEVTPQVGNRVAIGWGNTAFQPAARFVVPACDDSYGTGWLAYPGGYWADRPLCLPLTVRADGREQQVGIGVGTSCS